ncbi:unnamed protein product [Absidia cylindrospora]
MLFFKEQRGTSITVSIDRLANMYEMEWFTFQHLMDAIAIQEQGPKEALDVIQNRLKNGTCHQQLRLLEVLNYLVERSNQRILSQVVSTPKLKSKLKWIMKSKGDPKVKSRITVMMETWIRKYSCEEPKIIKFASSIIRLGHNQILDKSSLYRSPSSYQDQSSSCSGDSDDHKSFTDETPIREINFHRHSLKYTTPSPSLAGFSPFSRRYQSLSANRPSYLV